MTIMTRRYVLAAYLIGTLLGAQAIGAAETGHQEGHRSVKGVVVEKGGSLVVKAPDGATYQLNPNQSKRHGHEAPKAGDEVTVVLNENNQVMEIHPGDEQGQHRQVTGKLIHVGQMKGEIKLQLPDGEQTFPLDQQDLKTKPIEEGAEVTIELNEAGRVVDLHRANEQGKH